MFDGGQRHEGRAVDSALCGNLVSVELQALEDALQVNMPDNKNSNTNSGAYVPKSDYHYYKNFGGFHNFMHSYGLKPWNDDDVQEAKSIIEAFREHDRAEWEEAQKGQS